MPELVSKLDALPKSIEPSRELWSAIEARIEADRQPQAPPAAAVNPPRLPRWLAGAVMASVVALGVGVAWQLREPSPVEVAQRPALPPAAQAGVDRGLAAIHTARRQLEEALEQDGGNADLQAMLVSTYYEESRVTGLADEFQ